VRRHLPRPVRALVALQLLSGARAAELVALRPADLDTAETVWTYTPDEHKTAHRGKQRVIYFGPRAQRILRLFLDTNRPVNKPIFSPRQANAEGKATDGPGRRANQKPTPRKSSRTTGERYTTDSYRRAIHRACKAAGVEQWGPHRLRHNAGTFLRREYGIEVASIVLGHSSLAVTQTYAEQDHQRAIEVMRQVG
jgi:integrase